MLRKNVTILALLFFSVSVIFFTGCKKDSSNPVDNNTNNLTGGGKITLNGGGYSNVSKDFSVAGAGYSANENVTTVGCYTVGSDSILVAIYFPGKTTGTFSWDIANSTTSGAFLYSSSTQKYYMTKSGQTTITKYDATGGKVEGTFSGEVTELTSNATVAISGNFSAINVGDQ